MAARGPQDLITYDPSDRCSDVICDDRRALPIWRDVAVSAYAASPSAKEVEQWKLAMAMATGGALQLPDPGSSKGETFNFTSRDAPWIAAGVMPFKTYINGRGEHVAKYYNGTAKSSQDQGYSRGDKYNVLPGKLYIAQYQYSDPTWFDNALNSVADFMKKVEPYACRALDIKAAGSCSAIKAYVASKNVGMNVSGKYPVGSGYRHNLTRNVYSVYAPAGVHGFGLGALMQPASSKTPPPGTVKVGEEQAPPLDLPNLGDEKDAPLWPWIVGGVAVVAVGAVVYYRYKKKRR